MESLNSESIFYGLKLSCSSLLSIFAFIFLLMITFSASDIILNLRI